MAQVDFSNATIKVINAPYSAFEQNGLGLENVQQLADETGNYAISTYVTITTAAENLRQKSFRFTGAFTASGTAFRISSYWVVSNISFSNGDIFDFIIDTFADVV